MDLRRRNVAKNHIRAKVNVSRPSQSPMLHPDLCKKLRISSNGIEDRATEKGTNVSLDGRAVCECQPQAVITKWHSFFDSQHLECGTKV